MIFFAFFSFFLHARGAIFALWGRDELSDKEIQAKVGASPGKSPDEDWIGQLKPTQLSEDRVGAREQRDDDAETDGADPIIHAIMSFDHGVPDIEETMQFVEKKLLCHKRLSLTCGC